jgi:hypothetical protein
MGIEDEKTRQVKAVKRKVTEVETRQVKAVKRRALKPEPFSELHALEQTAVLPRGSLINEAGEEDKGWVFRAPQEKKGRFWIVLKSEPLLEDLKRAFTGRGYDMDVMFDGVRIASMHLEQFEYQRDAHARLLSLEGEGLASLHLKASDETVEAFTTGVKPILTLKAEHETESRLGVGRRSVGRLSRVEQVGILTKSYTLELSFEPAATGLERLCGTAMIVLHEAWKLVPPPHRTREERDNFLKFNF